MTCLMISAQIISKNKLIIMYDFIDMNTCQNKFIITDIKAKNQIQLTTKKQVNYKKLNLNIVSHERNKVPWL